MCGFVRDNGTKSNKSWHGVENLPLRSFWCRLDVTSHIYWYAYVWSLQLWYTYECVMLCVRMKHPMVIDWCCFYYFVRNSLVSLLEALCCNVHVALLSCFDALICEETYVYYAHTHVYTYTRLLELFARTILGTHMTHECVMCVPKTVTIGSYRAAKTHRIP